MAIKRESALKRIKKKTEVSDKRASEKEWVDYRSALQRDLEKKRKKKDD